jgi:hypothetical protein
MSILRALFGTTNTVGLLIGIYGLIRVVGAKKQRAEPDLTLVMGHLNRQDLIILLSNSDKSVAGLLGACELLSSLAVALAVLNLLLLAFYLWLSAKMK